MVTHGARSPVGSSAWVGAGRAAVAPRRATKMARLRVWGMP